MWKDETSERKRRTVEDTVDYYLGEYWLGADGIQKIHFRQFAWRKFLNFRLFRWLALGGLRAASIDLKTLIRQQVVIQSIIIVLLKSALLMMNQLVLQLN